MDIKEYKNKSADKLKSWLSIVRIQFYPMTWIAYSLGALLEKSLTGNFDNYIYWRGYILLFLIEFITILFNEYFDFETDSINKNYSMFTGGTRMLVEDKLNFREIRFAIAIVLFLVMFISYQILNLMADSFSSFLLLGSCLFLGIGYTAPPVRFCYKGLGELVVCFTHSPLVILCGFVFQGGSIGNILPWLYSIPLSFATFAAIILAGIPDRVSDMVVSKRTLVVILGSKKATYLALINIFLAAISGIMLLYFRLISGFAGVLFLLIIPHAFVLWISLYKLIRHNHYDRKINIVMQLALSYIIWFGIIPLLYYYWKA